ncbi:hypothetical protein HG536_0D00350 [Torulaspora globosa]|uniref:Protein SQS1 n=1 Tax=Torulaspora globosa TaxID=48254 RepID=A0A7G3ZG77_9SACH|nr:uncharacterized protein HG536_0D00350 [Torulaspora globosa]QLL32513.1 hypothetical protein HG536_0D00350 [Torulaspora globosa]
MAKRHSHYNSRGKPHGRGGSRGRGNRRRGARRQDRDTGKRQNIWHNSGLAMGDGDLDNPLMSDVYSQGAGRSFVSPSAVADYYFGRSQNEKSMKMGGLRLGSRNQSTSDLSSARASFRSRPMEFIRAKEIYDPSHDLIEQLRRKNAHDKISQAGNFVDVADGSAQESHRCAEVASEESEEDVTQLKNEEIFYVDTTGSQTTEDPQTRAVQVDEEVPILVEEASAVEFNPIITVGKTELPVKQFSDGISVSVDTSISSTPVQQYISKILANVKPASDESDDDSSIKSWIESSDSDTEPSQSESPRLSNNMETLKIAEEQSSLQKGTNEATDSEPEFGFLEEDYLVDLSDIHVTNMRLGAFDNSYFVRCFSMFADHEFRWLSEELFSDFILQERKFPEHRYGAYLKFIKASVIPTEQPPTPTYSDVPLSDESDEETELSSIGGDSVGSDMREGIDDLIHYSEKYSQTRNQEYQTCSLEATGKGRKKKLLIDESLGLDTESIATLQDKLSNRLAHKAKKRRDKQDFIDLENQNSSDLTKKYPAGLHVHNIRDEFEHFLTSNRDRLTFPALDPHGNRTIAKFAQHYNMKSSKIGSANHTQVVAQKTKKTHRSFPNYNLIDQLLKQRPIFMRIDVSRPKDASVNVTKTTRVRFHTMEGQVIGKDAPEIGRDNIGRRILEKLGWTNGEGLGAHGNKGISEPLMATVKKSKSGLRHDGKK